MAKNMTVHDMRDLDLSFLKPKDKTNERDLHNVHEYLCPCRSRTEKCLYPHCAEADNEQYQSTVSV